MKRGDLVWFYWRGLFYVSPILRVNKTTVTVAVSDGERRIAKSKVKGGAVVK